MLAGIGNAGEFQFFNGSGMNITLHKTLGQNRDAAACLHSADDGGGADAFTGGDKGFAQERDSTLKNFAGTAAVFPKKKRLREKLIQRDTAALGKGMSAAADSDDAVIHKVFYHQGGVVYSTFNQTDVQLSVQYAGDDVVRVVDDDAGSDGRSLLRKLPDVVRNQTGTDGKTAANTQLTGGIVIFDGALHLIKERDDMGGIFQQPLAFFSDPDSTHQAVEQSDSIVFLQFLDGKADGGLAHVEFVGCEGNAFVAADGYKDPQMSYGHGVPLF